MRPAAPLWKVLARAIGAVLAVFALVIGVLALFGDDSKTETASVQVGGQSATQATVPPTTTVPVTTPPTTVAPEPTPAEAAPPAPTNNGGTQTQAVTQQPAPAPAPDPGPPPPPPPPPPDVSAIGGVGALSVTLTNFPANSSIAISCFWLNQGIQVGGNGTSATTDANGTGHGSCAASGVGVTHGYAVANGVHSGHVKVT